MYTKEHGLVIGYLAEQMCGSWWEGRLEGTGSNGGMGDCSWDVLCERKINKNKIINSVG